MKEWNARAVVLWALGQGIGAAAAVQSELPVLAFALNELHEAFATYAIDAAIVQKPSIGGPDFAKAIG